MTGDGSCALICVPPAQHCIFRLSAFRPPLTRVPQGTDDGYPHRFSPMRAFRQLPLPKADASQNGFHPAYALSCKMAWRNSFLLCGYQDALEGACGLLRSAGGIRVSVFPADAHRITRKTEGVIKLAVEKMRCFYHCISAQYRLHWIKHRFSA